MFSSARRFVWSRHLRLALAAVAAGCVAAPVADADAATRYAAPTGTGAAPCLEPAAPCSIETATAFANTTDGDSILLAPGTYHPAASLQIFRPLTISGEPGKAAPLIEAAGERGLFFQDTATVRDLRIHSSAATIYGLTLIGAGSVIERVASVGEASRGCSIGAATVRDTVCAATPILGGGEGVELFTSGSVPSLTEASLFNVTAISGSVGIFVGANDHSTVILNATNTIASGEHDVYGAADAVTSPVTINLSHSNFESIETEGVGETHVTAPTAAGNQSAGPLFVNTAAGDYSEQASSPTRLAGDLSVVMPGEVDLAGQPRSTNCAGTIGVDIGAFQFECPTPSSDSGGSTPGTSTSGTSTSGGSTVTGSTAATVTRRPAPRLSRLSLSPKRFVAVPGKAPKGAARGAVVSFTLSAQATVKLEVLAKQAVKGKKPMTLTVGQLTATGVAGANQVKFSGKVKGKALAPGKYTLRAIATAAGLRSAPATTGFEVLAPAS
jgi:hypothetical protein